jgi:hypothetical protein
MSKEELRNEFSEINNITNNDVLLMCNKYAMWLEKRIQALNMPDVNQQRELLISFAEYLKERSLINVKKENLPIRVDLYLKRD